MIHSQSFCPRLLPVLLGLTVGPAQAAQPPPETLCDQGTRAWVWTLPLAPQPGEPLRIVALAADAPLEQLQVRDSQGRPVPVRPARTDGPPHGLQTTLLAPTRGAYRIEALVGGRTLACTEVRVGGAGERGSGQWDLAAEALYSFWIQQLFDGPPEQSLSWPALTPVLRDPARNLLHDALGTGEDDRLVAEPDCADLPYYLRAYFAWKLGLPMAWRACNRGSRTAPPRCQAPVIETSLARGLVGASEFRGLTRKLMDTVHSGSARTALADEATDYYPVPLRRETLWPGTVFADPYGHVLVVVQWVPQSRGRPGMLLAVDAQPDNSLTRKRFWEGTFLFADTPSAGPGFKAYRPVVTSRSGVRLLTNAELDGEDGRPPFSTEQARLSAEEFYVRMEQLINPAGLAPEAAYASTLAALLEQLETRVTSVDNGEAYLRRAGGPVPMPTGAAIFETTGPWEDYATPSRDMRLLIALDVLENLPERIRRFPQLYLLRGERPEQAAARIEQLHARALAEQGITYTRSDGSPWHLSLAEIYARRPGLEVGYNPNDCVERRWGATPQTPDHATCRRQAPPEQQARMEEYRPWFHDRQRPPR